MPRDMTGTGRYPPSPKYPPFAFYSTIRLGDPEQLAKIMEKDPYFWTQDNGAGAPIHFATTYKQLDMLHHILNNGGVVNQRDAKGFTALHRAAYLAHFEGYLEIYEYLLSRGADPSIRSEDYDPYLNPGKPPTTSRDAAGDIMRFLCQPTRVVFLSFERFVPTFPSPAACSWRDVERKHGADAPFPFFLCFIFTPTAKPTNNKKRQEAPHRGRRGRRGHPRQDQGLGEEVQGHR
mmetsp:Transcript_4099/g.11924  ORF Transcript_4099/g.11924 Transcript_4099/m.11924 type:complete len:234 (-) Transcript_4099:1267-1968(-)